MASSGLLVGKRCLVTGGNRGIGKAIAETFAREGASLALLARNKDKLEEVCKQSSHLLNLLCGQLVRCRPYLSRVLTVSHRFDIEDVLHVL